jgi:tetratricopeptide (TPR) repeat protein
MSKMDQYFYNGQFLACFEEAKRLKESQSHAEKLLQLFSKYEYETFPIPTKNLLQSVERPNETYEEYDEVEKLRAIEDEAIFQQAMQQLEQDARTGSEERKAQSFFVQGHLFLMAHHYDESVHCFMQAVKHNPNKALFYGICGQTMQRFNWSPFDVLPYLERAIELDPKNARWYWNQSFVLTQLFKDLQVEAFLENALIALEKATALCRKDQLSLRNGIDSALENMKEYLFN